MQHSPANRFSRRASLQAGAAAAALGLWSPWLARAQADSGRGAGKARSVIMIFNCGGPSHLDLWDPKPLAPADIRGQFSPIATNVPGLQISELLPDIAPLMSQLAVVRSVHHGHGQHNAGMYWSIVGQPYPIDSTLINPTPNDPPGLGTLVGWLAQRDESAAGLPPYVITPHPHCDSFQYITPGQFGGCLGSKFDPFVLNADPNASQFKVRDMTPLGELSAARLRQRRELVERLDAPTAARRDAELGQAETTSLDRALHLVSTGTAAEAFDLTRESAATRDRYGRHSWGQSHLLARRLVERGARFVTTVNGPSITWDTHVDNFGRLKKSLVPPMQRAFAALLGDLAERGLLESTLVLWTGDFGRTPKINKEGGRDHWPQCYSVVLAGGGVRGGQFFGSSDRHGAHPRESPVSPADIHATVLAALGYAGDGITYPLADGRPMPLTTGRPIEGLL